MSVACLVKLGGSLLDLPDLRRRLLDALDRQRLSLSPPALLVGGGPTTDAIRTLDRIHRFGEATAHALALRALTVNSHAVRALLGRGRVVSRREELQTEDLPILDPCSLLDELEGEAGRPLLPHSWEATSDSVALVLAGELSIPSLVLLKSVGPDGPLEVGGRHPTDMVDPCFVELWRRYSGLVIEVIALRS